MKILEKITLIVLVFLSGSCEKKSPDQDVNSIVSHLTGDGVFIINEGNFLAGNGTLSFYSYSTKEIYNDIFSLANGRPLGDVSYSMVVSGTTGYIVVNNSGKVEVVDKSTMQSLKTIEGLNSPRKILLLNSSKAYISSLYSNSLAILDLKSNSVSGSLNIRRSSESMVLFGNKVFISSWYNGQDIMVVDPTTDKVIDSIAVGSEPETMVLDKNNKLWVLCSADYSGNYFAELVVINTSSDKIEKQFPFSSLSLHPSCLQINRTKDTIYYVNNDLWRMSILSSALPDKPFRFANGRQIYKLGVDQRNGRIFYTDAVDYQQKGYVLQTNPNGVPVDSCQTDIIPGSFCFK
jgi:YVTN family beta-propeller protein